MIYLILGIFLYFVTECIFLYKFSADQLVVVSYIIKHWKGSQITFLSSDNITNTLRKKQ